MHLLGESSNTYINNCIFIVVMYLNKLQDFIHAFFLMSKDNI